MPRKAPMVLARAGAMTTAKSTGVSRGTRISRGVRALRARRRRDRVANAADRRALVNAGVAARGGGVRSTVALVAVIWAPCRRGQAAARRSPVRRRYTSSRVGALAATALVARPRSAMAATAFWAVESWTGMTTVDP